MEKILYIGGFELPDRNAAAQRVVAIAKGLLSLGHEVFFLNYTNEISVNRWTEYAGFRCYESPKRNQYKHLTSITDVRNIIKNERITRVIAYNYPAVALFKLIRFCHNMGIKCYADVTEWYGAQGNILFKIVKTLDTEWRMRFLHRKMDGVIAISDYLYQYYKDKVLTVKIPPTVDTNDEKWQAPPMERLDEKTTFVYAGTPAAFKERLDLILEAADSLKEQHSLVVRVIGITEEQYETMYGEKAPKSCAVFLGRIPHKAVIREVKSANWSIIIRDNNKVVKAGFPTKVVESIACGTPVIANRFSNIADYLDKRNSILSETTDIAAAMENACLERRSVDASLFDYRKHIEPLRKLIYG